MITRYACPVDGCRWTLDEHPMRTTGALLPGPTIQDAISATAFALSMQRVQLTESELRAHLDTHTVEDYIRTINQRDTTLARMRKELWDLADDIGHSIDISPGRVRSIADPDWRT